MSYETEKEKKHSSIISLYVLLFVALCLCVCAFSCITQKKRDKICASCPTVILTHDSVHETVVYKDTTIYVTSDPVKLYLDNPCASLCDSLGHLKYFDTVYVDNGIREEIKSDKGRLEFSCKDDSLKRVISGLNSKITELRTRTETKIIEAKCELKHHSGFDSFTNYWFWICVLLAVIYLLIHRFWHLIFK